MFNGTEKMLEWPLLDKQKWNNSDHNVVFIVLRDLQKIHLICTFCNKYAVVTVTLTFLFLRIFHNII